MDASTLAGLGAEFTIDPGASFEALDQIERAMGAGAAKVLAEAEKIERATRGMIDVGGATVSIQAFGGAVTRAAREAARELARIEKAGEAMSRSLDRQASTFGKTREEIRAMRVEAAALAAEEKGLTELAGRLRSQQEALAAAESAAASAAAEAAAAAAQEAQAQRDAALAARAAAQAKELLGREAQALRASIDPMFAAQQRFDAEMDRAERLYAAGAISAREYAAAQTIARQALADHARAMAGAGGDVARQAESERMAAAAARLRASIDPASAAQQRFNAEMDQARSLIAAGAISLDEYVAKLRIEREALESSTRAHNNNRGAMAALAPQFQDAFTQISMGANVLNVLAVQGGQAAGQMVFLGGTAGKVGEFFMGPWGLAITGALLVLGGLTDNLFKAGSASDDLGNRQAALAAELDRTTGKIKEQVSWLSVLANARDAEDKLEKGKAAYKSAQGQFIRGGQQAGLLYLPDMTVDTVSASGRAFIQNQISRYTGGINGGLNAEQIVRNLQAQAGKDPSMRDAVKQIEGLAFAVNDASNKNRDLQVQLARTAVALGNATPEQRKLIAANVESATSASTLIDKQVAVAEATSRTERARAQLALVQAQGAEADRQGGAALAKYRQDVTDATREVHAAEAAEKSAAAARRAGRAAASAARREANHEEQLAREAAATEAQIRNLLGLAEAYRLSGGAALIAEAQVKAESKAIKERGQIDAEVDRQVRLAIATRLSEGQRSTAAMREQAAAQAEVNAMVRAGKVPAQEAAELVKDRIADLPLLGAIEAATVRNQIDLALKLTNALAGQRAARAQLRETESEGQLLASTDAGARRLAELREELRLIGQTDEARARGMAEFRAAQEASAWKGVTPKQRADYIQLQGQIAAQTVLNTQAQDAYNAALTLTADKWDIIAGKVQGAAQGMADAFGEAGRAIGDVASIYANYEAERSRAIAEHDAAVKKAAGNEQLLAQENARWALRSSGAQITMYGDMASAAKGFFREGTAGYQAMQRAEQVFRAVQFALSVRAMAQNAAETATSIANSAARTATHAVEAVVKAIASLPFPLNLAAGAATVAALASLGVSIAGSFGGGNKLPKANDGTGTVLGDTTAKSDSIKRALDALKEVDTLTSNYAREMSASLKSIDSQIGNVAGLVVRAGDISANAQVKTGFEPTALSSMLGKAPDAMLLAGVGGLIGGPIGWLAGGALGALTSITRDIPIIGDILGGISSVVNSLFGSSTSVIANGLYGRPQSVGSIMSGGFDANYYSDVEKKKRFFGIVTGRSYSTKYADAAPELEQQFTLILRSFAGAIKLAAGPLGESTAAVEARLNSFVVDIGKIDLKGLSGQQIQEKLSAVFGAAADKMAASAFPGIQQFQRVGEGAFETLVRVASTVDSVNQALGLLGQQAQGLGTAAKLGLADQFDSVSAMGSAVDAYFKGFYSQSEQAAARQAQMAQVFSALGITMPATLTAYRQLVEAQDLNTAAGRETYATLLKLAPAFADLKAAMEGAKSAADVLNERGDLERQLLQLQGNTAAIRALDLAKLDASNRELQQQIWALQDAQEAAKAADELRKAWTSVGDSIMDEVKRIRGLTDVGGNATFASLMGQFNAATLAARGGDQDAAKSLPQLSQALLAAAAKAATSRQELDRVQAQTAASLEATYAALARYAAAANPAAPATAAPAMTTDQLLRAAATSQPATVAAPANDDLAAELRALRSEVAAMRADNNAGHAATASNTGGIKRTMDRVTAQSGGDAISTVAAA